MSSDTHHFLELLWGLTERELRARYKRTVFGFLWILINPLLQMLVIGFIFSFFIKQPIENYFLYLFTGLLAWNFFSLSWSKATPSLVYERSLIKKAQFPRVVIPLSIILSNFVNFLIASLLLLIVANVAGELETARVPMLLVAYCLLLFVTCGLGLLTSALNVRFRDVNFFVSAALIVWFYATPIIYPMSFVPQDVLWIWYLNPLTSILQLLQHGFIGYPLPETGLLTMNVVLIFLITLVGALAFKKESAFFDDWL